MCVNLYIVYVFVIVLNFYDNIIILGFIGNKTLNYNRYISNIHHETSLQDDRVLLDINSSRLIIGWALVPKDNFSYAQIYNIFPYLNNNFENVITHRHPCHTYKVKYKIPKTVDASIDIFVRKKWPPIFQRPGCCPKHKCKFIISQPWEFGFIPKIWIQPIISNVDYIWAVSAHNANMFINSGIPTQMVKVIPEGVDCLEIQKVNKNLRNEWGIQPTTRVFAYVGGLLPRKGIDIALNAYIATFSVLDDVLFLMKLSYHYYDAEVLGLIERIQNSTTFPRLKVVRGLHEMGDIYAAMDVLVHPARAEGLGMTPMEALAAGKVVITPNKGATMEYASAKYAVLIPAEEEVCTVYPCRDSSLCVFWIGKRDKCEELVKPPTWIQPDVKALAVAMRSIHEDFDRFRARAALGAEHICSHYQWKHIAERMKNEFISYQTSRTVAETILL